MRLIDACALAVQIRDNVFHDFTDEFWGVMQCIREAPIVEPKQKTGRWLANSFHEVYCDQCGFYFDIMKNEFIDKMKFCPNCGAGMV